MLPLRHRAARAQRHADGDQIVPDKPRDYAIADRRSVFQIWPDAERQIRLERCLHATISSRRMPRASASGSRAGCSTATASRCRIACWRSGRPTRRAVSPIRRTSARCRIRRSRDSAAAAPMRTATMPSTPSSRAACPIPTASRRRRIFCWRCLRAACCCNIYTRIYFDGEAANAADPVLALVPADRRATLIARAGEAMATPVYRFDVHLQGDNETVFFDV